MINVCSGLSIAMDDLNQNDDERMIALINRRWYWRKSFYEVMLTDRNVVANCVVPCIQHHIC